LIPLLLTGLILYNSGWWFYYYYYHAYCPTRPVLNAQYDTSRYERLHNSLSGFLYGAHVMYADDKHDEISDHDLVNRVFWDLKTKDYSFVHLGLKESMWDPRNPGTNQSRVFKFLFPFGPLAWDDDNQHVSHAIRRHFNNPPLIIWIDHVHEHPCQPCRDAVLYFLYYLGHDSANQKQFKVLFTTADQELAQSIVELNAGEKFYLV